MPNPKPLPDPDLPWPILMEGVANIAQEEGLRLEAYQCQAGVWTIGWGETAGVQPGDTCTKEDADQRLCDGLTERADAVRDACKVLPSRHQLAALVGFAYNYGGWRKSTVLAAHNAGDHLAAARAFGLVNKFTNPKTKQLEVSRGLTARRAREAAMYLTPDGDVPRNTVQAVQAEAPLAKSPIAQAGTATAAGGAVTVLASLSTEVQGIVHQAADMAATLGIKPALLAGMALLAAGVVSLYWRWRQRTGGFA